MLTALGWIALSVAVVFDLARFWNWLNKPGTWWNEQ